MAGIGDLWRKAGFRWVFPIGTLPLPYHPLIRLVFLLGPPLWIAWLGASALLDTTDSLRWWHPLVVALLLGIPMSIPIVSWVTMIFAAPLAQAVLFAGSMILLAIEVWAGRAPVWWAALPAGFVALYVIQRFGGRMMLAKMQRMAAEWTPIDPGDATVVAVGGMHPSHRATDVLTKSNVARIVSAKDEKKSAAYVMQHWLSPGAIARLRALAERQDFRGWSLPSERAAPILRRTIDEMPADGLTMSWEPYRSRLGLVTGSLQRLRVRGPGIDREVIWGHGQVVGRFPLFTFFHWTAIVGRSSRHVGFARESLVRIGPEGNDYDRLAAVLVSRPDTGGRVDDDFIFGKADAGADSILAEAQAAAETLAEERIADFWRNIALPRPMPVWERIVDLLKAEPGRFRPGDGARLAAWIKAARAGHDDFHVHYAATLIEALPDGEFAAIRGTLYDILNSRIMAGEWHVGPDLDFQDLPKDCPRFGEVGGFGLALWVPGLYRRFAALGPEEKHLVNMVLASLKTLSSADDGPGRFEPRARRVHITTAHLRR